MTGKEPIMVGVVGAAHGLRGEVRVKTFTGTPAAIGDYGPLATADGRLLTVAALRPLKDDMVVVRFEEVADRNAAEALTDTGLFVERARLPAPDTDEFYHTDLIGLAAELPDGGRLGRVTGVENYGGGDLLEIALPHGERVLVPFRKAFVPVVDIGGGRLVVEPEALDPPSGPDEPTGA